MHSLTHTTLQRRIFGLAAAGLIALLGACGNADKTEIADVVQKGVVAVRNKDIEQFIEQIPYEIIAPDSSAARRLRDRVREDMGAQWALITQTHSITVALDSVRVEGDSAFVSTRLHWDRYVKTADGNGQDRIVTDAVHHELWRRTSRGWRSYKVISFDGKQTINGKEVPLTG